MCGLFGAYSTTLTKAERNNAIFLGILSCTRGLDSTGVLMMGRKGNKYRYRQHKDTVNAVSLFESKEAVSVLDIDQPFLLMGHARAATLGEINAETAHPLEEGSIIGCHNGTIDHFFNKAKATPRDSDSRELFRRIHHRGLPQALRDAGSGAYAISFIDMRDRSLNFSRNLMRPLWFMHGAGHQTLYWASEFWMLESLRIREGKNNFSDPWFFKTGVKYTYKFGSMKSEVTELKLEEPKAVTFLPKPDDTKRSHIFDRLQSHKDTKLIKYMYKGWKGNLYNMPDVAIRLQAGCSGCKSPKMLSSKSYWFASDEFVCENCYENDPIVQQYLVKEMEVFESSIIQGV